VHFPKAPVFCREFGGFRSNFGMGMCLIQREIAEYKRKASKI